MSARRIDAVISSGDYAYVNEDQIDSELKCIICQQPFIKPMVGKKCGHTFCSVCINNWYKQNSSCPSCRLKTSFEPLTARIVLSQLDRLVVRCSHCDSNNIERGNFNDHINHRCRRMKVKCKAANLNCSWTGSREEQAQHSAICPLLQIRPIVEELKAEIMAQGQQLQIFMNEVRDQLNYLQHQLAHPVQSSTNTLDSVQNNTVQTTYQKIINDMKSKWKYYSGKYICSCNFCRDTRNKFFTCLVCSCAVARPNVGAHDTNGRGYDVICQSCVNKHKR